MLVDWSSAEIISLRYPLQYQPRTKVGKEFIFSSSFLVIPTLLCDQCDSNNGLNKYRFHTTTNLHSNQFTGNCNQLSIFTEGQNINQVSPDPATCHIYDEQRSNYYDL